MLSARTRRVAPQPGPDLAAYGTRLAWGPAGGIARMGGVQLTLDACPQPLPGRRLAALDYAPGLGLALASDAAGRQIPLTRADCEQLRAWLEQHTAAARAALESI